MHRWVFPVPVPPDEDCAALGIEEGAGSEFAHLPFIDRRVGEDELVDILWRTGTWSTMR